MICLPPAFRRMADKMMMIVIADTLGTVPRIDGQVSFKPRNSRSIPGIIKTKSERDAQNWLDGRIFRTKTITAVVYKTKGVIAATGEGGWYSALPLFLAGPLPGHDPIVTAVKLQPPEVHNGNRKIIHLSLKKKKIYSQRNGSE